MTHCEIWSRIYQMHDYMVQTQASIETRQPNTTSMGWVHFWHLRWCCQHRSGTGVFYRMNEEMTRTDDRCLLKTVTSKATAAAPRWVYGPWHGQQLKIAKLNKQAAAIARFLPPIDKKKHKQPHTHLRMLHCAVAWAFKLKAGDLMWSQSWAFINFEEK